MFDNKRVPALGEIDYDMSAGLSCQKILGLDDNEFRALELPEPYVGMPVVSYMQANCPEAPDGFAHAWLETKVISMYRVNSSLFMDLEEVKHKGMEFYITGVWSGWYHGETKIYGALDSIPAEFVPTSWLRASKLRQGIDRYRDMLAARHEQVVSRCGSQAEHPE